MLHLGMFLVVAKKEALKLMMFPFERVETQERDVEVDHVSTQTRRRKTS